MNRLIARTNLFDDFFKDVAPGFYVKPLHGEGLPAQIRVGEGLGHLCEGGDIFGEAATDFVDIAGAEHEGDLGHES